MSAALTDQIRSCDAADEVNKPLWAFKNSSIKSISYVVSMNASLHTTIVTRWQVKTSGGLALCRFPTST